MDEITTLMLRQIRDIDERDEGQILQELAGETVQELIYKTEIWVWEFNEQTRRKEKRKITKYKLSWSGTKEAARNRGNIVLADPVVSETEEYIRIIVKGTDLKRNFTIFGGTHQPKKIKVKDYDNETGEELRTFHLEEDQDVFQKGLSKAQRNCLNGLIPADYMARMIAKFLQLTESTSKSSSKQKKPTESRTQIAEKAGGDDKLSPSKIKPREEWDKVTKEQVPDYATLEKIIWDLSKMQPNEMYKALGIKSRTDATITAWDAFNTIKEFCVPKPPASPPPGGKSG